MKITTINNNISFQKTLEAKAHILKDGEPMPCNIYSIDSDDKNYFIENLPGWENSKYYKKASALASTLTQNNKRRREDIFVLEDEKEKCLGFVITSESSGKLKNIDFLEVIPKYAGENKDKGVKYIGETILAFLAKKIKKSNLSELFIFSADSSAKNFYTKKCGFDDEKHIIINTVYLPREKFDKLIEQNAKHTKGEIEIITQKRNFMDRFKNFFKK